MVGTETRLAGDVFFNEHGAGRVLQRPAKLEALRVVGGLE